MERGGGYFDEESTKVASKVKSTNRRTLRSGAARLSAGDSPPTCSHASLAGVFDPNVRSTRRNGGVRRGGGAALAVCGEENVPARYAPNRTRPHHHLDHIRLKEKCEKGGYVDYPYYRPHAPYNGLVHTKTNE